MPDRIFGKDESLNEAFEAKDLTGIEYADGHYVEVTCRSCSARWGLEVGEMGEVPAGPRNSLLAHAAAHLMNGHRVRPPLFKLPKVAP